ncbi:MAG: Uma2 family endonuclease [Nodosilinea sp. WJT8-NPBG4]|jgi:Uma2 family endonuclease|nr:Uma2 family endonuclease [Nodosilinea sp. WJT8-NPBG4]
MVATKLSLADFLSLDTGPENRCEFVDGEVVEMPPESEENVVIGGYLVAQFLKILPFEQVRQGKTELIVTGRVRIPDFMVLSEELVAVLAGSSRSTITEEMPAPLLVVEVVSPGKTNEDRDYRYKRSEYAARGIPEYWIVDAAKAKVTVLTLVDGLYEAQVLQGEAIVQSPQFPELSLVVAKVLSPTS